MRFVLRTVATKANTSHRPKSVSPEDAAKTELLVPIRLDVDVGDGYNRFRDTFVWNANGQIPYYALLNSPDLVF